MDIEGTMTWADLLRLMLFFGALWMAYRMGRVHEALVRDREEEKW